MNVFVATFCGAVCPKPLAEFARKTALPIPASMCFEMGIAVEFVYKGIPDEKYLESLAETLRGTYNAKNPSEEMLVCQFDGYESVTEMQNT